MSVKKQLESIYLDYVNNYITIEKMAEDNLMDAEDLKQVLLLAKKINSKEYALQNL